MPGAGAGFGRRRRRLSGTQTLYHGLGSLAARAWAAVAGGSWPRQPRAEAHEGAGGGAPPEQWKAAFDQAAAELGK